MPDIDRTADIKVTAAQGMVTAAVPLAGHASEHWLTLFRMLASQLGPAPRYHPEAEEQEDRTWVIVNLPPASEDQHPEPTLDAVSAVISEVNGMEQQFQSAAAQTEAAIRDWWARQQR
jgi:hypothetical protein